MQAGSQSSIPHQAVETADRLHSAAIHLLRGLRKHDRESGVGPAQLSALSVLVFGGPKSLAKLAQAEQVKAPTMSRIVAGLLRGKFIQIKTDAADRRAVVISAGEKGVRLMQVARTRRVESLARALSTLSQSDLEQLRKSATMIERLSRSV